MSGQDLQIPSPGNQKHPKRPTPPPLQPSNITITYLPTKNDSLIAEVAFKRGNLIIAEPPLLTFSNNAHDTSSQRSQVLYSSLSSLLPLDLDTFFSLFNAFSSPSIKVPTTTPTSTETTTETATKTALPLPTKHNPPKTLKNAINILRTNCLPLSSPNLSTSPDQSIHNNEGNRNKLENLGVFRTISRANHSCIPNAEFSWHVPRDQDQGQQGQGRLFAIRAIDEGEEVVIDYTAGQPFKSRAAYLEEGFKFICTCEVCVEVEDDEQKKGEEDGEVGDGGSVKSTNSLTMKERFRQVEELEKEIIELDKEDLGVVVLISRAIVLLEQLRIRDLRVVRLYNHALQTALALGDLETSCLFARLCWKGCVDCLGADHFESEDARDFVMALTNI